MRMSEIEILTDAGRRHRWCAADKMRIVEVALCAGANVSAVVSWHEVGYAVDFSARIAMQGLRPKCRQP